ncbi:pyrophosphatase PpaX [Tumebacillus sp. DT12]|uniref:Pyrophosphatase PpaX n=1 Tax=Tumebacillus lacus TaxID=2995335 RepID=A0ABT3X2A2_9BACL|nr:pyrophosphatase PpaX [Tumebacillus lacus]MCX7571052.1 pyrophosphatase PpaX [Tumebacillus lacus]
MRFRYVLFDLDGTLLDTNELILRSVEQALEEFAPGRFSRADILPHMGEPLSVQVARFLPERMDEVIARYRQLYMEQHDDLVTAFPHAKEVLERLARDGYRIAVVTSKIRRTAELGWKVCGLPDCHEAFLTIEDTDKHKPDPEPVLKAVERLGAVPAETVMIGDSPYDILAGRAAGVATIGVKWSLRGEEGLREYRPDFLVEDMLELEAIIRGEK